GNNLPLVGTALLQLHETGEVDWARLSNYAMNRRLVNLRFTKKKTGEIALLLIAVFTRMHCLVSLRFITKVLKTTTLSEPVDVVEQLVMEGHVISQMLNREVLLDVGHPSMANLLLDHFGNELYQGLKEEPMKSSGNLENLETEIWIDYLKQPAPNLSTFLVNLSSGLIQYQRYRPALELLKAIEEMEPDDASLSIGLTNIGVILDNSGRMTESKRAYELALELDESSGFTWANLGNLLCHMQDLSGARSAHEKASSLLPDLGLIHSQLGNVLSDLREFDAAENAHELAINLEPENPLIWSNMGAFYTDKKLFKKSLQAYHKAVEIDELWIDAWIGLAKVYHMLSRKKEARKAAAKAIRIEPKGFFHFLDLGALFTVLGRVDLGQEAIENALRIYPNSGEALLVLSETLKQSGRLEEFENYYQRARPLESSSPGIFISIGNTLMDLDEFNLAIDMYESALKLDPGSGEALYRIALIKGMQGELDAAEVFFSEALKSGYDVETVSCDYANLLIHTGTPKKAVEVLSKFLEENESANGLFILGRARTLLGDGEGAIKAYKDAIKIQPDFYQAWYNLGNCFLRKKNLSWAERAYRKALSINRQYTKARTLLAQVLHWMGKSEQGLRELRKAVKNNPGNPVVYNNLASALFAMGRREEAIKYGKMASEIAKSEHQKLHELVDFQLDMLFGDDDSDSLQ
ncbi:MAG: tetratricopeptide repeat protein, partial [Candidatus Thorarchaeota archaeon]